MRSCRLLRYAADSRKVRRNVLTSSVALLGTPFLRPPPRLPLAKGRPTGPVRVLKTPMPISFAAPQEPRRTGDPPRRLNPQCRSTAVLGVKKESRDPVFRIWPSLGLPRALQLLAQVYLEDSYSRELGAGSRSARTWASAQAVPCARRWSSWNRTYATSVSRTRN